MKKILFFTVLCCAFFSSITAQEAKYGLKSGILYKESEVMGQTVQMEVYFDDYGKKESIFSTLNLPALLGGEKSMMVITEGEKNSVVTVDLDEKTAVRSSIPSDVINFLNLTPDIVASYNVKDTGKKETIAGKVCKIYTIRREEMGIDVDLKTWVWEGISLKTEASGGGMGKIYTETVTQLKENPSIPTDKFTVPPGVIVTE